MEDYSQSGEQKIILNYFNGRIGVFADIGANDGETLSNTRALALLGWGGILVEAADSAFVRLSRLYRNRGDIDLFFRAVSDHDGEITLNVSGKLIGENDVALVSTVHGHEMNRFKGAVDYTPVTVRCSTWKSLIEKSQYKHFDFVSLDIEGSEMDVLPFIDLSKTDMLCIEFNGNQALKEEYEKYLSGFNLIYTNAENLIYAR